MTTYKLQTPVTFGNKTYDSLTFRKMKAKDLSAMDVVKGSANKGFAMLASIAEVPFQVIGELDFDDLEGVQEVAAPFLEKLLAKAEATTTTATE